MIEYSTLQILFKIVTINVFAELFWIGFRIWGDVFDKEDASQRLSKNVKWDIRNPDHFKSKLSKVIINWPVYSWILPKITLG